MTSEEKQAAESLIPSFRFQRVLNLDQNGRRITLLGSINSKPALLNLERAAFPTDPDTISTFISCITNTTNLGANDIYHWYMACHQPGPSTSTTATHATASSAPDLKLNLIYPCTDQHVQKYSPQAVRMVTETPEIYAHHVQPFMQRKRDEGRLNWVFNIIEGRTEQEDVILRERGATKSDEKGEEAGEDDDDGEGFLLLPDLNWDRKTVSGLHLLALVERRDIWSLRDLKKRHVLWLKHMRDRILKATVSLYGDGGIEADMLKLYVHYQPTYYHFHIHVVNALLDAGPTQATGKAFGLENIISQLDSMHHDDASMADVSLTYSLGEASELWQNVFGPLKGKQQQQQQQQQ